MSLDAAEEVSNSEQQSLAMLNRLSLPSEGTRLYRNSQSKSMPKALTFYTKSESGN